MIRVNALTNARSVAKSFHLILTCEHTFGLTLVSNLTFAVTKVRLQDCGKRFTQSSNLAAHEKSHLKTNNNDFSDLEEELNGETYSNEMHPNESEAQRLNSGSDERGLGENGHSEGNARADDSF